MSSIASSLGQAPHALDLAALIVATTVIILVVAWLLLRRGRTERRLSQLALADFGIDAVSAKDFDDVLYRAMETARTVLAIEYSAISFVDTTTGDIRAVSATHDAGMQIFTRKLEEFPADHLTRFLLGSEEPVIFKDLARETRFGVSQVLRDLKAVSGIAVSKRLNDGVHGLVTMFSTKPRHFTSDDAAFLTGMFSILAVLRERELAIEGLRLRDRALEAITQGITIINPNLPGYPTAYTNPAFAAMTGYSKEEMARKGSLTFLKNEDASAFAANGTGASVLRVEVPLVRKDGTTFADSIAVSPIRDSSGKITHYVTVHEDVTQLRANQKRLDQKVREQSAVAQFSVTAFQTENLVELLRQAADLARTATDTDFASVLDVDPANDAVRIVGRSGWGSSVLDVYKLSRLPPKALVPVMLKHKGPLRFSDVETETRFETDDVLQAHGIRSGIALAVAGGDKVVSLLYILSKTPREYSDDDVEFLTTLLNLVVAVRERNETLMRLRLRDRALDSISQGITISDETTPETKIIYTNPAFAKMTGYGMKDIIGLPSKHFLAADAPQGILDLIALNRAKRRSGRFESRTRRKDGTSFLDSVATSPIISADGELTHYVSVHEDLTESRQRDSQLRESQKMEAVGQLTGGIAHDFNNLLTVVKANAEDLKDELTAQPLLQRQAEMVLLAADRGADLVKQLMAFARKQELEPKVVSLNAMLEPFVKLVRRTLQENIVIDVIRGENLPSVKVDPSRLENAILNLVINARDAMPEGGRIVIETRRATLDRDYAKTSPGVKAGDYVLISVSDTGQGMNKETMAKAFQPFFTTKEVGRGTGLGLSMVYGFVKQSGGHAKLYSEVGHGTTIKIYLPPAESAAAAASSENAGTTTLRGSGSILVVEDDELVRASVCNKLERMGYKIISVDSAAQGIATLEKNSQFDLIFTDVIMPGEMTGADLAREVQRRWPSVNVLMTSGYTEASALGKVKIPEGIRLLSKPYSNADLAEAIQTALKTKSSPRPSAAE